MRLLIAWIVFYDKRWSVFRISQQNAYCHMLNNFLWFRWKCRFHSPYLWPHPCAEVIRSTLHTYLISLRIEGTTSPDMCCVEVIFECQQKTRQTHRRTECDSLRTLDTFHCIIHFGILLGRLREEMIQANGKDLRTQWMDSRNANLLNKNSVWRETRFPGIDVGNHKEYWICLSNVFTFYWRVS